MSTAPSMVMVAPVSPRNSSRSQRVRVEFVDWTSVTEITVKSGRVVGARVQDWRTGEEGFLRAGSVILATGGGGQIFSNTDNPGRITGDGYALALGAGAVLRDMEFVQFYPLGWAEPGFPRWIVDLSLVDFVRVTDCRGVEFLKRTLYEWGYRNGTEGSLFARDRSARLVAEKDREGGVYAHLEDLEENSFDDPAVRYCLGLDSSHFKDFARPLRVAPLEHYFCGGVVIDSRGRTAVDGLFACGEVTGGVDGASRVGGNALSSVAVFGLRTGEAAAEEAGGYNGTGSGPVPGFLHEVSKAWDKPLALRKELQRETWKALGPIREPVKWRATWDFFRTSGLGRLGSRPLSIGCWLLKCGDFTRRRKQSPKRP